MEFRLFEDLVHEEFAKRKTIKPENLCTYGIAALDKSLKYILPDDLIVIGADSGVGKSDLGISIAIHNAQKGKKVAIFYLEGGHNEAIQRILWKLMCLEYFNNKDKYEYIDMNFIEWLSNENKSEALLNLELKIRDKFIAEIKDKLFLYDVSMTIGDNGKLSYQDIYLKLSAFFSGYNERGVMFDLDLLIIDHLHYFDFSDNTRINEAEKLSKIMRQCKEITDLYKLPVIVMSHLRKKTKDRGTLPDQEDFHGSSNIPKISTCCITLTPDYNKQDNDLLIYPTYFRIVKSRYGIKANYALLIDYFLTQRKYSEFFKLYKVDNMGNIGKELEINQLPKWARESKTYKPKPKPEPVMWED